MSNALLIANIFSPDLSLCAKLLRAAEPELVRVTFTPSGRLGTVELDDGSSFDIEVDADLSGRGARFVTFCAPDDGKQSWVRERCCALLDAWDAHCAREVWL
jgi:hypothetical protein